MLADATTDTHGNLTVKGFKPGSGVAFLKIRYEQDSHSQYQVRLQTP